LKQICLSILGYCGGIQASIAVSSIFCAAYPEPIEGCLIVDFGSEVQVLQLNIGCVGLQLDLGDPRRHLVVRPSAGNDRSCETSREANEEQKPYRKPSGQWLSAAVSLWLGSLTLSNGASYPREGSQSACLGYKQYLSLFPGIQT